MERRVRSRSPAQLPSARVRVTMGSLRSGFVVVKPILRRRDAGSQSERKPMDRAPIMPPLTRRRLTAAERRLGAEMFGASLDSGRVRILALPVWPRAFVAGPRLVGWAAGEGAAGFRQAPRRPPGAPGHQFAPRAARQRGD